jgi:hypothetical protein
MNQPTTRQMNDPHMQMMYQQHLNKLWVHFGVIVLGCWLLASPAMLGYLEPGSWGPQVVHVTQERHLPLPDWRAHAMLWSDLVSGCLLIVFGSLSIFWRHRWAQWGTCFTGIWLLGAPLLFWAPDAASTNNDMMIGALAIAFSILIPMMPGMSMASMKAEEDIPPGWDYSPSSWSQRLPIIALAFFGFFIARHLMAYQMGHISTVWEPFFGEGTARIITSDVSKAWPVPDAGLGALSYLLEALSGMMGGRSRWRTMPWMVGMFCVLVIPLCGVSIFFIIIQPIVIGTWCTPCQITAAAMVVMLPYSFDEIVAMFQFLLQARREGQSLWQVFWHGGTVRGASVDPAPPLEAGAWHWRNLKAQGRALPKALTLSAVIGIWLMFTRLTLGNGSALADSDHLVGALVFTFSIAAFSEVVRPLRAINLLFGAWLIVAPWLLSGAGWSGTIADMLAGALLILLAIPRGPIRHSYGAWDRALRW